MNERGMVAGLVILGVLLTGAAPAAAPASGLEDPLARRIIERLQSDRDRVLRHRYTESVLLEKLARDGTARSRTFEVYEVRPASGDARPAGAAGGDGLDLETLVGCFRLYPLGREALEGRQALRVAFTAIDGCVGGGTRALRLLGSLAGTLWLDAGDYDVLRVRGYLQHPVTFGLGVLGRVERFELELDREPIDTGFYATTRIVYRARGSSLLLNRFDVRSSRHRGAFAPEATDQQSRARLSPVRPEGPAATPR